MKTALITGIYGQDGHYLSELLLRRGYRVIGLTRREPEATPQVNLTVIRGDVTDWATIADLFSSFELDEIYNLAGPSFGPASWNDFAATGEALGIAPVRLLEGIRASGRSIRLFQASSSEQFGCAVESPQSESTPFQPLTPYGLAKLFAHQSCVLHRQRFGTLVCCGILFNHESPHRRPEFVTRKITRQVARIKLGIESQLVLGDLEAQRDWGFAGDFADAMWRMLQHDQPDDYVVATGVSHSVREFCDAAFRAASLDYSKYVVHDPALARPDRFHRIGDPARIRAALGWRPALSFEDLVGMMVEADIRLLSESGSRKNA
jgi:GDPmannose 4,6-dehydratase